MSRINTNMPSLMAQRILARQNKTLVGSLERLSTGLAINRGSNNPAGLIASEGLRSDKVSIAAAIGNAKRAGQVINITEGGLQEINELLVHIQGLVTESANDASLGAVERNANQLQVDSIIQAIDHISATTSFQDTKLLNGALDFMIVNQDASVATTQINSAKLAVGKTRDVTAVVIASAQRGALFLSANNGSLALNNTGANLTFEIAGTKGVREFAFASGASLANMRDAINSVTGATGIVASVFGTGIRLKSEEYGSSEFVSVKVIDDGGINAGGGGATAGICGASSTDEDVPRVVANTLFSAAEGSNAIRDSGQDISVIINGIVAAGNGKVASVKSELLDLDIEFTNAGATSLATIAAYTIQGGGAKFLIGLSVNINNQVAIGIGNMAARSLGKYGIGFVDDLGTGKDYAVGNGDLVGAQSIVDHAIMQVSKLRGRLGAFQKNTIGSSVRTLEIALENISAAESLIRDTDFASETARLTRAQILVSAATNVLAIANTQPQSILVLIG